MSDEGAPDVWMGGGGSALGYREGMEGRNWGGGGMRTHERFLEIRALVWLRWAEIPAHVGPVLGAGYGVLVFVGRAAVAGEGFGEPVGGADEGHFGVEVLGSEEE